MLFIHKLPQLIRIAHCRSSDMARCHSAGLLMSTYLEAHTVVQSKRQFGSAFELSEAEVAAIEALGEEGDVYGRLARCIAPEIFGMEDVKKVCLL